MNISAAIEKSISSVIRDFCDLPEKTVIRAWQNLEHDATWDLENDRTFPMIEVRCSPPRVNENQSTLYVDCAILIATAAADDRNHSVIRDMFTDVLDVTDALFAQRPGRPSGPEIQAFTSEMSANVPPSHFALGGISYGDSQPPFDDRGINMIGISLVIHYTRDDF